MSTILICMCRREIYRWKFDVGQIENTFFNIKYVCAIKVYKRQFALLISINCIHNCFLYKHINKKQFIFIPNLKYYYKK